MRGGWLIWLSAEARGSVVAEAAAKDPLETGGVMLGYWTGQHEVVVTRATGPGPLAIHRAAGFLPDHDFHVREIAAHYERTGGVETYLGDWHTHPGAAHPYPSSKDRATVKRIASDPAARAPNALMMILAGENGVWRLGSWIGTVQPLFGVLPLLKLGRGRLRQY